MADDGGARIRRYQSVVVARLYTLARLVMNLCAVELFHIRTEYRVHNETTRNLVNCDIIKVNKTGCDPCLTAQKPDSERQTPTLDSKMRIV